MDMIHYVKTTDKVIIISLSLTDTPNKIRIPKSIVNSNGIFDGSKDDDKAYIDTIEYRKMDYDSKNIIAILLELNLTGMIYATDVKTNKICNSVDKLKYYDTLDSTFIDTLFKEIDRLPNDSNVVDLEMYLKAKIDIPTIMTTKQLFMMGDMLPGVYYSYYNKLSNKKSKIEEENIDISKTRLVLGKNTTSNIYAVYNTSPIETVDTLYKQYRDNLDKIDLYTIFLLHRVQQSNNLYYMNNNQLLFKKDPRRLESPTENVLVSEILPAGIAYYGFEIFNEMNDILRHIKDNIKDGNDLNNLINITDLIYSDNAIIHQNDFKLDIKFDGMKIPIFAGVDIPTRNKLKHMEKNAKVYIFIVDKGTYILYYGVVQYNDDYLIMSNYPANVVVKQTK